MFGSCPATPSHTPAHSATDPERWLTVAQVADLLGVKPWSAYQLINANPGHFTKRYVHSGPTRRRYRIAKSQVDEFMSSRPTEPDGP